MTDQLAEILLIGACFSAFVFVVGLVAGAHLTDKLYRKHLREIEEMLKCNAPT